MTATVLPMWTRQGTCQPDRCGSACCTFMTIEVNPIYLADADIAAWVRLHGIDLVEWEGRTLARIPLACSALDAAGRCSIYGQPERPSLCADFPMAPAALFGIEDRCTYAFTTDPPAAGGRALNTT